MLRPFRFVVLWLSVSLVFLPVAAATDDIDALLQAGRYQDALAALDRLPAGQRNEPRNLFSRARALAASGQLDKAVAQYQQLIKLQPDLPEPYNNLAVIYIRQNKLKPARDLLNRAMATHPAYARIYKNLTAINAARAQDAYAKALQMPTRHTPQGLETAETLSPAAVSSPQAAPRVTEASKSAGQPALIYQADSDHADKNTESGVKNQPLAEPEAGAVKSVLEDWARAWSTKNVEQYLHFYSDDYAADGLSHPAWAAQRRERISKPKWIRVTLHNMQITALGPQRVRVRLEQEYAADNYSDVTRKEFLLQQTDGQWRIFEERGLGYIAQ